MPQICDMGLTTLLPFQRKACWGFFRPEKSWRLQPGLNPRTWVLKGSTLTLDHRSHYDGELTDSNIIDKGYQTFTILVITEKNKNLFANSQRDKMERHCSSKILQCQNRYLPSFRFLLGGLRFRKVMPLSSSKAVTSRSSGDCSFGRSPSPMYSIQVLPTSLGSEYIDIPGYKKTITIRCVECIQVIKVT